VINFRTASREDTLCIEAKLSDFIRTVKADLQSVWFRTTHYLKLNVCTEHWIAVLLLRNPERGAVRSLFHQQSTSNAAKSGVGQLFSSTAGATLIATPLCRDLRRFARRTDSDNGD
jgi:hypothetical protein